MSQLNFVFFSLQRILTDRDSTATNIAKELAKQHRVLYINPPIDRRTFYFKRSDKFVNDHIRLIRQRSDKSVMRISDNMWVLNPTTLIESINWIPNTDIFSYFNLQNNKRLSAEYTSVLKNLGFDQFILINDKDIYRSFHMKELLKPALNVYLDRDYIVAMQYWKKHGSKLEPLLMGKSDLVLCNSPGFTERAKRYNLNSYYIGNGCDTALFDSTKQYECPSDLKSLQSKPIIGYVGALVAFRLDIGLLLTIARSRPEWNLVLVGGQDAVFARSELHKLPNVYFLGKKNTTDVPAYLSHFDVCINPQLVNSITMDNYPLKIDEYLAMGRPVVAVRTQLMEQIFLPYVRLADNSADFIHEIEESLHDLQPDRVNGRVALARSHSWEVVTAKTLEIVKAHLGGRVDTDSPIEAWTDDNPAKETTE